MKRALDGIKVADFSWVAMGPVTTRYLADNGATVVRVESRTKLDVLRTSQPFKDGIVGPDRSPYFANYNAGKYGMTLNMNKPEGRDLAVKLAAWCDILVESFTPGVMDKWGLGYESLKKVNPDIIMASTTQLGRTGPYSQYRGFGMHAAAIGGFCHVAGWPDREPVGPYGAYVDFVAHRYLVVALLSALQHRRVTGRGQYIDQSQVESAIHFLAPAVLEYSANGRVFERQGNCDPLMAPHGAYRCLGDDRWAVIAVATDKEWASLGLVVGQGWTKDPKFATLSGRKDNEAELDRLVEEWTVGRRAEDVMQRLQKAGVAAALTEAAGDLHSDPQFKHRDHYKLLQHPVIGLHTYDSLGFRLSKTPVVPLRAAQCLGEHNHYVCTKILGLTDEEFVGLDSQGAFD